MKIYVIEPNKRGRVEQIDGSLGSMQAVVGGPIELCQPISFDSDETLQEVAIICNEEGKLNGSLFNFPLHTESGAIYDVIAGTCFLCHAGSDSEDFESISDAEISAFCAQHRH